MPSRAWIATVAVGITFWVISSYAQETTNPALEGEPIPNARQEQGASAGEDDTANEEESPTDITPFLQGIEAAIRDLIAEENEIERQRQEDRDVRDLEAQENMARWAKAMF